MSSCIAGKQRSKQEQEEHKRPDPEVFSDLTNGQEHVNNDTELQGDTRKIIQNATHGQEKRKEEEKKKAEKKDSGK